MAAARILQYNFRVRQGLPVFVAGVKVRAPRGLGPARPLDGGVGGVGWVGWRKGGGACMSCTGPQVNRGLRPAPGPEALS